MDFLSRQIARAIRKPITILLLFLTLSVVFTNVRADFAVMWTTKSDLPGGRSDATAVTYNNMLYVFGGYEHSSGNGESQVYAYDPSNDSWTQTASMDYARWGCVATVYNGSAFVFGGDDGADGNRVESYYFANDSWATKNNLPDDLAGQGEMAVTVGSMIYIFGGWSGTSAYSYNPLTDSYIQLASIPYSTRWGTCAYVTVDGEDRIYIMGGYDYNIDDGANTMYYYRPAFNDWIFAGKTPYAAYGTLRDDPVINGLIYFGYGHYSSDFFSYLFSYDPSTATWNQLPQGRYPREGIACGVINSKLYVVGGRNSLESDIPGLNYNEQYDTGWLSVSIDPTRVRMALNQSQTFTSSVSGGNMPYSYQWYLNSTIVPEATNSIWNFTPTQIGNYTVFVNVVDSRNNQTQSNIVNNIQVYDVSQINSLTPDWNNVTQDFFNLVPGAENPVLTGANVTDREARFVADPFIFHEGTSWYMFFEVESVSGQEEIGVATSSNGFNWTYQQIVLSDPSLVLSYPYVFKWEDTYYMIPNTYPEGVMLYEATNFPYNWTLVNTLISNQNFIPADSSIFRYNNTWWMFTGNPDELRLFYSHNLIDPASWYEHPMSPILTNDPSEARGGGRVIVFDSGRIIRLTQKDNNGYGEAVRAFEIDKLNETYFAEHEINESPIVSASGEGWNGLGMHTVDPWWSGSSWIACVDGLGDYWWSIGIYVTPMQGATISPTHVSMDLGQSYKFSSSPIGGKPSYSYQWYLNDTAVNDATDQNWAFSPLIAGNYNVHVNITDALNTTVQSNTVTDIIVYSQPTTQITPVSVNMTVGMQENFNSSISDGAQPFSLQWYINGTEVTGATGTSLIFTPFSAGTYTVYLKVTDNNTISSNSNIAKINVYPQLSAIINPTHVNLCLGQSQTFNVSISGGKSPYTYQWYINGTLVPEATGADWTFISRANGNYQIYVNITDSLGTQVKSNMANNVTVFSVYLILNSQQKSTYFRGEQLTFTTTVVNQQNLQSETTISLTIRGPGSYYFYDFQPVKAIANGSEDYTFTWVIPNVAGTYVIETNLVPSHLTAYDAKWIEVSK